MISAIRLVLQLSVYISDILTSAASRVERSENVANTIPWLDYDDDEIENAFDKDEIGETEHQAKEGTGTRSSKLKFDHQENEQSTSPSSLQLDVPWLSLKDPEQIALTLISNHSYFKGRHSRTSSDVPSLSSARDALDTVGSRSQTASAPEVLAHLNGPSHHSNGVPTAFHGNNWPNVKLEDDDADGAALPTRVCCSPPPPEILDPNSQNTVAINGPDAEQTVPYASRVLRFFTGIKGPDD